VPSIAAGDREGPARRARIDRRLCSLDTGSRLQACCLRRRDAGGPTMVERSVETLPDQGGSLQDRALENGWKRTLLDHAWPRRGWAKPSSRGRRNAGEDEGDRRRRRRPPGETARAEGAGDLGTWVETAPSARSGSGADRGALSDLGSFLADKGLPLLRLPRQAEPRFLILLDGGRAACGFEPDLVPLRSLHDDRRGALWNIVEAS